MQLLRINFILLITSLLWQGCVGTQLSTKTDPPTKIEVRKASKRLEWDQKTLRKVSSSANGEGYCGYARILELPDKSLLCIYEANGNIVSVKSTDSGGSWSLPSTVATKRNSINVTVPDILKLADGSLLIMYNLRPTQIDPSRRFGIAVKKSLDNGNTWKEEKVLYQAGYQFENGCWEPAAIQLPNGQIQLYFANEGPYTSSSEQNISMLRSNDGGHTWTSNPEIVSFRKGSRDGMPVPLLLQSSNIVVAIEDNGVVNFKPYIISNTLEESWKTTVGAPDKNRSYALALSVSDTVYAGSPYIRQLSTGETILSYQGTDGRASNSMSNADMKVVVGDRSAANFELKSTPFIIPANQSALWNSVAVLNDDTIIALTSTQAFNNAGRTEVWMIKGRLRTGN